MVMGMEDISPQFILLDLYVSCGFFQLFPTLKREWDGNLGKIFAYTCGQNRDGFFLLNHPKPLHHPKPLLPSPKALTIPITLKNKNYNT